MEVRQTRMLLSTSLFLIWIPKDFLSHQSQSGEKWFLPEVVRGLTRVDQEE